MFWIQLCHEPAGNLTVFGFDFQSPTLQLDDIMIPVDIWPVM